MRNIVEGMRDVDLVRGNWYVSKSEKGVSWCDASCVAMCIVLEISDDNIEDIA